MPATDGFDDHGNSVGMPKGTWIHRDDAPPDGYTPGYRDGFVKGYDDGIRGGRIQGFQDAKRLAFQAVNEDEAAVEALECAIGEL